jgi:putative DNA primase/helicase
VGKSWQKITFADTQAPAYQRRLAWHADHANIGVRQGDTLQSIDIDDSALVRPFLELNPVLRNTAITKAVHGCQFHVRTKGAYPNSQATYALTHKTKTDSKGKPLAVIEWRCGGKGLGSQSVVSGVHPDKVPYQCNGKPVLEIKFDQIRWPDCVTLPWSESRKQPATSDVQPAQERVREGSVRLTEDDLFKKLSEEYGEPAYRNSRGRIIAINERFFAELLRAENYIVHEATEDRFYLYCAANGLWERATTHGLKSKLSNRIRQAEVQCRTRLRELDTEHNRRNIISLLRGIVERKDYFKNRPHAVHAANCMLVFEKQTFVRKPFAPEFLSRNQLTVTYDSKATCPRFESELLVPALGSDDLVIVKKMFGLLILGRNRPQRIFIFIGPGNTGKTTTGLVAEGLVGQENCAELRTTQLDGRFELARLVNKTLVFGPDVSSNFLLTKGAHRLKSIVGGDPLIAERKNSNEPFPFKGDLNALITANEDLLVRLHGDFDRSAWERRLCLLPFKREPIATRIFEFHRVLLKEEGSGILNYALQGLLDYYQDEAARGDLVLNSEQQARIESLLTQSEGFRTFLTTELVETEDNDVSVEELITAYAEYAKKKGWRVPKRQTLEEDAQDLMLQIWSTPKSNSVERNEKNVRGYRGIRLRREDENDPEP